MNDEYSSPSCFGQNIVQPWHKLLQPANSIQAVMAVPDITDNDRGLRSNQPDESGHYELLVQLLFDRFLVGLGAKRTPKSIRAL